MSANDEANVNFWLGTLEKGIEIGGLADPLPGLQPIYVNIFKGDVDRAFEADVEAEPTDLPFQNGEMDYVAASRVFERLANPLAVLGEWTRITRDGGLLYLIVSDYRYTSERTRPVVSASHLLDDYDQGVLQSDGTHIDEFVETLDWKTYSPSDPSKQARENYRSDLHATVKRGLDISINFHAFEPNSFSAIVEFANEVLPEGHSLEIIELKERFPDSNPDGFLIVMRVTKVSLKAGNRSFLKRLRSLFGGNA